MRQKKAMRTVLALVMCVSSAMSGAAAIAADSGETVQNSAPIAKDLEYTTYRGVSVKGVFEAVDPDGDEVTFTIAELPHSGSIELVGNTEFIYIPFGRKNTDSLWTMLLPRIR